VGSLAGGSNTCRSRLETFGFRLSTTPDRSRGDDEASQVPVRP
jgi:hypothetical protein